MLALGWGLAAVLGAVAGMMAAPTVFLDPNMMLTILIYAFAAAVLGGIDSPVGAVVGGLLLGVTLNLLGAYVDSRRPNCGCRSRSLDPARGADDPARRPVRSRRGEASVMPRQASSR